MDFANGKITGHITADFPTHLQFRSKIASRNLSWCWFNRTIIAELKYYLKLVCQVRLRWGGETDEICHIICGDHVRSWTDGEPRAKLPRDDVVVAVVELSRTRLTNVNAATRPLCDRVVEVWVFGYSLPAAGCRTSPTNINMEVGKPVWCTWCMYWGGWQSWVVWVSNIDIVSDRIGSMVVSEIGEANWFCRRVLCFRSINCRPERKWVVSSLMMRWIRMCGASYQWWTVGWSKFEQTMIDSSLG